MEPPSKEFQTSGFTGGQSLQSNSHVSGEESGDWKVLPDLWKSLAKRHGNKIALFDPHRTPAKQVTYGELEQSILDFSEGLQVFGITQGQTVSIFSDNSYRWIIADQGVMMAGASDAVRGAKAPAVELMHIAEHSDSSAIVVENVDLLAKLVPHLQENGLASRFKFVVLLWGNCSSAEEDVDVPAEQQAEAQARLNLPFPVYSYSQLMGAGHTSRHALAAAGGKAVRPRQSSIRSDDIATLVYTSGTTGNPKAVMLTHANLLHQINTLQAVISPQAGDTVLSLLPPWHMYERSAEYFILSKGVRQVYSSVKTFKEDLAIYPPDYFVAVPLVFEILYSGVQKKLAETETKRKVALGLLHISMQFKRAVRILEGRDLASSEKPQSLLEAARQWVVAAFTAALLLPLHLLAAKLVYSKIRAALGIKKVSVSGGGSLSTKVDMFFEAIGITLVNGYGLTETSPVLTARKPECNTLGTVGPPLPKTEVKVVDLETNKVLPAGQKGAVKARGPQIMKGYYKNPNATVAVIDEEGWFDTGDLGWLVPHSRYGGARACGGQLVLAGRVKDTIVLASGENVEPEHIEEAALQSPLVQQIMVVGQDERRLGALIVPNRDEVSRVALAARRPGHTGDYNPTDEEVQQIVRRHLNESLLAAGRTHIHERIGSFVLLTDPFSVDNGLLTPTMKMKRGVIAERYQAEIASLFQN